MMSSVPRGGGTKTVQEEVRLNGQQVTLCFANSKFIIIDEMVSADQLMLIRYDEFLEYTVRVADLAQLDPTIVASGGGWTTPPEEENSDDQNGQLDDINEENGS